MELGILLMIGRGVRVLTANGDDLTEDPFKVAMARLQGASLSWRRLASSGK
jgi:hypothetical protein